MNSKIPILKVTKALSNQDIVFLKAQREAVSIDRM